jgi:5,10-methylene-tetrahydrofolate dehydrogenase/methenyl tetrahydrofolate cyclohydrolase
MSLSKGDDSHRQEEAGGGGGGGLIDGKTIAASIQQDIKNRVTAITNDASKVPGLAVILVGSRRDSQAYVNMKKKACAACGISSVGFDFEDTVTQETLLETIRQLNDDDAIHGILIQLPLPSHINQNVILQAVDPEKDVDGLHPLNVARLQLLPSGTNAVTDAGFAIPCTPLGCLVLLDKCHVELQGKHCVVLGRSQLVGLPMARLLLSRDATVTICHSKTKNIPQVCRTADVLIAAVGQAALVQPDWIKPGAVVIDVGINSVDIEPSKPGGKPYKLVGDVGDFEQVKSITSLITPVPGGVGPMTIAMLLQNTLSSFERKNNAIIKPSPTTNKVARLD